MSRESRQPVSAYDLIESLAEQEGKRLAPVSFLEVFQGAGLRSSAREAATLFLLV